MVFSCTELPEKSTVLHRVIMDHLSFSAYKMPAWITLACLPLFWHIWWWAIQSLGDFNGGLALPQPSSLQVTSWIGNSPSETPSRMRQKERDDFMVSWRNLDPQIAWGGASGWQLWCSTRYVLCLWGHNPAPWVAVHQKCHLNHVFPNANVLMECFAQRGTEA